MKKKKKPTEKSHSEACAVHFGMACTCVQSEPVKAQRLYLEEKWMLYRREVLAPSGIDKYPKVEAHMRSAFAVGAASTMALLFKDRLPVSIAKDIEAELAKWTDRP